MSFGGSTAFVHPAIPITLPADLWNYAMILLGVPADRLWVNPDCGLKTRKWEEVRPALANLVAAAKAARGVRVG